MQAEQDVAQLRAEGAFQNDEKLALYYWEKDAAEVRVEAFEKRIKIVLASNDVEKMDQEYLEAATFLQEVRELMNPLNNDPNKLIMSTGEQQACSH